MTNIKLVFPASVPKSKAKACGACCPPSASFPLLPGSNESHCNWWHISDVTPESTHLPTKPEGHTNLVLLIIGAHGIVFLQKLMRLSMEYIYTYIYICVCAVNIIQTTTMQMPLVCAYSKASCIAAFLLQMAESEEGC